MSQRIVESSLFFQVFGIFMTFGQFAVEEELPSSCQWGRIYIVITLFRIRKVISPALPLMVAWAASFTVLGSLAFVSGCVSVKTEHRVEPIQITMDVNVRLERELEESFGALDARSREIAASHSQKGAE